MSRLFWLPCAGMQRLRWAVAALLLQLLALGAILVWVDNAGTAIGLAMTAAGSASFWLWMAPVGSLLMHWRQGHDLRLPRQGRGFGLRAALLLAASLLPASALIGWRSADADWAVFMSLLLLLILLAQMLFFVTPFRLLLGTAVLLPLVFGGTSVLALLLPVSRPPIDWNNGLRIVTALLGVGASAALLGCFGRRFVKRSGPGSGGASCMLDLAVGNASASAYEQPERGLRALPALLLPRQRLRPGDSVELRLAHLLAAPYAPRSTRRLIVILGAMGLIVAAMAAVTKPGVPLELFVAQTWVAVCITFTVSTRLATLYRRGAPELSELALLPGQGNADQRRQRMTGLLLWRPLVGQLCLTLGVVLAVWATGLARSWSQTAPLLCLGLLAAALMTWETARYIDRGEGWFGKPWAGSAIYVAALVPWLALLAWSEIGSSRPHAMLDAAWAGAGWAVVALAAFSAWRARAACLRSIERPHALAAPADRIATADRA